ncbi:hypothetical protein GCM10017687_33540 [Streptomyces echinatus]
MDFNALYHANFKLLDDAVTDWSTLVDHLADLKKDAEDDLHKAALKADWAGVNAQVSREFIGKTAGEFGDAHTQATTIRNVLRDTQGELKSYHQQLTDAVSRGRKKNLTVTDAGTAYEKKAIYERKTKNKNKNKNKKIKPISNTNLEHIKKKHTHKRLLPNQSNSPLKQHSN